MFDLYRTVGEKRWMHWIGGCLFSKYRILCSCLAHLCPFGRSEARYLETVRSRMVSAMLCDFTAKTSDIGKSGGLLSLIEIFVNTNPATRAPERHRISATRQFDSKADILTKYDVLITIGSFLTRYHVTCTCISIDYMSIN
jgi:hypothetical protein